MYLHIYIFSDEWIERRPLYEDGNATEITQILQYLTVVIIKSLILFTSFTYKKK